MFFISNVEMPLICACSSSPAPVIFVNWLISVNSLFVDSFGFFMRTALPSGNRDSFVSIFPVFVSSVFLACLHWQGHPLQHWIEVGEQASLSVPYSRLLWLQRSKLDQVKGGCCKAAGTLQDKGVRQRAPPHRDGRAIQTRPWATLLPASLRGLAAPSAASFLPRPASLHTALTTATWLNAGLSTADRNWFSCPEFIYL